MILRTGMATAAIMAMSGVWAQATAQNLAPPLDCGRAACVVQNFADVDSSSGVTDQACGSRTYDGHDGLDFRVPGVAARAGVAVRAPAAGVVRGARDGEADGVYVASGRAAVQDRECGNGVVIDHADGWSTQLCHMKRGSLTVKQGDRVVAGQSLGMVGLSGFTQFPHVHMTLRRNGVELEPVAGGLLSEAACKPGGVSPGAHWSAEARPMLANKGAQWFELGFAGAEPKQDPSLGFDAAARDAPALLFWGLASGPKNGDVLRVKIYKPDGTLLAEGERMQPRDQAQAWLFAGRRTPAGGWPPGIYRGEAILMRGGAVIEARRSEVLL